MQSVKSVSIPLTNHFKLSNKLSSQIEDEEEYMSYVPYSSVMGSIMYIMICTKLDISQAVSVVNHYTKLHRKTY